MGLSAVRPQALARVCQMSGLSENLLLPPAVGTSETTRVMPLYDLSIIIPALDEAVNLPRLFQALAAQRGIELEIILADGGSRDNSVSIAQEYGVKVVSSEAGRGLQMNAGTEIASAEWLLFLHADSRPCEPAQLRDALTQMRAAPDVHLAGHFALEFERRENENKLLYRYMQEKSASGRRYSINGDQGLLIQREWFLALGGFDTGMKFLEDQRIAAKIRAQGRWLLLPGRLVTSARRFETEGARARYLLMAIIMALYVIDLRAFFTQTPNLYVDQEATRRLLLTPVFRTLWRLMRAMGVRESLRRWGLAGDFVLHQSWEIFFVLDVALRPLLGFGRYPATRFHDRVFAPLAHHRVGKWIVAGLVFAVLMGIFAPWYRWRERHLLRRAATTAG